MLRRPPRSTLFPTRRSSDLAKGWIQEAAKRMLLNNLDPEVAEKPEELIVYGGRGKAARNWQALSLIVETLEDRKSTRLNSSHVRISYAVFCLKKKKKAQHSS